MNADHLPTLTRLRAGFFVSLRIRQGLSSSMGGLWGVNEKRAERRVFTRHLAERASSGI